MVFLLLTIFACTTDSQEEVTQLATSKIIGSWQVIAHSYSIGGPLITEAVANGGIYNYALNGTFTFKYALDNTFDFSGSYTFDGEVLTLDYSNTTGEVKRTLKALFEEDSVELIPINPFCIEGCSETLKRLN